MKPVTHHITLFTPERVPAIRLAREIAIGEARTAAMTKGRKKGTTTTKSRGRKAVVLDTKAREALAAADPAVRAFLEANL